MKKGFLSCLLLWVFSVAVFGGELAFPESLTLRDGTQYENVRLISQTPAEIVIRYSDGVKNLKIAELDDELQALLNYSEEAALAVVAAQEERTAKRLERQAAEAQARKEAKVLSQKRKHAFMIRGYVHRVLGDGLLIQAGEPSGLVYHGIEVSESERLKRKYQSYPQPRPQREFGVLYVEGHPQQEAITDLDVIDIDVYRDGVYRSDVETRKKYVFIRTY